jgi:hypothetical protein
LIIQVGGAAIAFDRQGKLDGMNLFSFTDGDGHYFGLGRQFPHINSGAIIK